MSSHRTPESFEDLPVLRELRERLATHFGTVEHAPRHMMRRRRWPAGRRSLVLLAALVIAGGSVAGAASLSGVFFADEPPLPAKATVVGSGSGRGHQRYVVAVMPSKCPGWAHIELRATSMFSTGGCGEPVNTSVVPRVFSGACGAEAALMEGTVSARARAIREVFQRGVATTTPVYAFPSDVHIKAGVFVLTFTRSQGKLVTLQALDAHGHVLASATPPGPPCFGGQRLLPSRPSR